MKKNGVLRLLVILLVFCFIGCGRDDDPKIYTVTIGTLKNGEIIAYPTSGIAGTEITLTVIPKDWFRYKSETLKYGNIAIDQSTLKFNLPAENVIINAEFISSFIGLWKADNYDQWYNFLDDGTFAIFRINLNRYFYKGNWIFEEDNIINLIFTHISTDTANYGSASLDELTVEVDDFTDIGELYTDNTLKIYSQGGIATFIQ